MGVLSRRFKRIGPGTSGGGTTITGVSDVPGLTGILNNKQGLLTAPGDVPGMSAALATRDAAIAAKQTLRSSFAGGRPLVSGAPAVLYGASQSPPNWVINSRTRRRIFAAGSDPRFLFDFNSADNSSQNDIYFRAAVTLPSGSVVELPFGGKPGSLVTVGPGGYLLSEPLVGVDLQAGDYVSIQTYERAPSGNYVQLYANAAAGATSLQLQNLPAVTSGRFKLVANGTGTTAEWVTVTSITGSSAPYTVNLAAPTVYAHVGVASGSAADLFGQSFFFNEIAYSDEDSRSSSSTSDLSQGTIPAISVVNGTLAAATNIGDTKFTSNLGASGINFTIDGEAVTVRNVIGASAPYTYILTAAFTAAHASGATIIPTLARSDAFGPTAVIFDRPSVLATMPKTVLGLGDSIMSGVGYVVRSRSWFTDAFVNTNPLITLARAGEAAYQFVTYSTGAGRRRMLSLLGPGDWVLWEYGVNDIYGGRTLAQLQADTISILTAARIRGAKIAFTTLTPRTTSTDAYATVANQSVVSPSGYDLIRQSYNTWVKAGASGYCDLVVDLEAVTDSGLAAGGAATGKWRADNGDAYTPDGIHPTYLAHTTVMKNAVNTSLFV